MFNTSFLAVLLLLALGFSPTFAWGQTSNSAEVVQAKSANVIWTGLADRIDSERGKIDPSKFPEIQPAIDAFTAATQRFDQFLKNKGTREVREGWQVYLEYDRVLHEIQFGNATQRSNEATDLAFKLARNRVGLERAEIAGLRDAARHVAALAPWSEPDRGRQILENQLTALAELYRQQTTDVPSAEAAAGTATVINSLRQANQLPQLADALSDRFRTSNLLLHLSSDALASLLSRPVNDTRPVNECILGTRILGQAYANGQVTTRLLPSQGSIRLELVMQSHVTSIGIGYNGPVKAHTESNSDVLATKVLTITEQGISASPATAAANLRSRLRGIEHPLPIVRRIAANKAAQQKPQSEAIARQRLEVQTETSFDHQVEAQLQTSGSRLALTTDALVLLNRLGLHEPVRHLSSDQQHVRIDSWIRAEGAGLRPWTFGATRGADPVPPTSDAAVQLHETAVENWSSPVLAGRVMTGEQLTELVRSFDRMRPETVRVQGVGTEKAAKTEDGKGSEDDRDFVIQFSAFRPVVFEARDGKLRLGLRGDRFESEGRKLTRPLQITAVYRPVRGPNGWYFELEGKAEVDFPGRKKLSVGEVALRTTIQRKLADKFPERILDRALPLPDRLRAVGPLAVQHLDANNGWLTVAFD